jgi:fructokinase
MSSATEILVFGEVLFDCFQNGEQVLGGAPFNVAWHLQAFGDRPQFVSRVGDDELGRKILSAMRQWQMDVTQVQIDPKHATGRVEVTVHQHEPSYRILPNCAYDFIDTDQVHGVAKHGLLYHGTLGLRSAASRKAFSHLCQSNDLAIFLDVNLREPWWNRQDVQQWLSRASWIKLNHEELKQLGFAGGSDEEALAAMHKTFPVRQIILTRGERGALVRTEDGEYHSVVPIEPVEMVDAVGAGDAFSAVYIHGLMAGWPVERILQVAQQFASQVLTLRGAIVKNRAFYLDFMHRYF